MDPNNLKRCTVGPKMLDRECVVLTYTGIGNMIQLNLFIYSFIYFLNYFYKFIKQVYIRYNLCFFF